jgi:hypothetical protein
VDTPAFVDDRVHGGQPVDLLRDAVRLVQVRQVPDHERGSTVDEIDDGGEAVLAARVDHDRVPAVEQVLRGRPTEATGGAGHEDAGDVSYCSSPI